MNVQETLAGQFGTVYAIVARNVEGLTQAGSLAPAAGGGNTANWILGHLVNVQNGVMALAGAPPVWESEELQRARFDRPIRDAADAIDFATLVERFQASREGCLAAIASLSNEALAEPMRDDFGDDSTRGGILATLAVHQSYHAGQLGMLRRAAGLRTAILAPGQKEPLP